MPTLLIPNPASITLSKLEGLISAIADSHRNSLAQPKNVDPHIDLPKLGEVVQKISASYCKVRSEQKGINNLRKLVSNIKEAIYKDFKDILLPRYLKVAKSIDSGIPVATLASIGMGSKEIRYTQLLRFYLDPKMPHGLGDTVLRAVIGPETDQSKNTDWENAIVHAEYGLGQVVYRGFERGCDIDLLIETNQGTIMIENKINSVEDNNSRAGVTQLERYSKAVDDNCQYLKRPLTKIFLTPTGKDALKASEWKSLSFLDVAKRLLKACPMVTTKNSSVSLASLILDLLQGPLNYDLESILAWKKDISMLSKNIDLLGEFKSNNAARFKDEQFLLKTLEQINA